MASFAPIGRPKRPNSLYLNAAISLGLLIICFACYAILIIIFVRPTWTRLNSLTHVDENSRISPTVVIGILSVVLTGATTALVTRAVEHSLWLKLVPREVKNRLTVPESRNLAQWSVSPYERLRYFFVGSSWLLKIGGLFLFGTAALNPVLLSGVNPQQEVSTSTEQRPRTLNMWQGYLDPGNSDFRGTISIPIDNPMRIAALAYMSNLTAPGSDVCRESTCRVSATMASLQATCTYGTGSFNFNYPSVSVCSKGNPSMCVELDYHGEANFTTGLGETHTCNAVKCPGQFCTVLGIWRPLALNMDMFGTVDCQVRYGNASLSQTGDGGPQLDGKSFVKSVWNISGVPDSPNDQELPNTYVGEGLWRYPYIHSESLYDFQIERDEGMEGNINQNPIAAMLLAFSRETNASAVAERIEKNFEMSTLLAFARAPESADLTITTTKRVQVWTYNPLMLLILLVPLIATLLGLTGRLRIGSDDDVVGYDPVEIARRGPVSRFKTESGAVGNEIDYDSDDKDEMEVWGAKQVDERRPMGRVRFVVG